MTSKQIKEIIYSELSKVYKLCKYIPSEQQFELFLETLSFERRQYIKAKYENSIAAYNKLFIYRHWYIQKYHKQEVDNIMQMVLLPEVFAVYQKRYKTKTD